MILNDANLTPMQKGRLDKVLAKEALYDGIRMTLKAFLESVELDAKKIVNGSSKWNKRAYNRMDAKQQNAYEKKLISARYYEVFFGAYCVEIPKILFDVLELPDVTDLKRLEVL